MKLRMRISRNRVQLLWLLSDCLTTSDGFKVRRYVRQGLGRYDLVVSPPAIPILENIVQIVRLEDTEIENKCRK